MTAEEMRAFEAEQQVTIDKGMYAIIIRDIQASIRMGRSYYDWYSPWPSVLDRLKAEGYKVSGHFWTHTVRITWEGEDG